MLLSQLQEMALVKPDKPEMAMELGAPYEFVIGAPRCARHTA